MPKLYGSVNGASKQIKKLYGSVNGVAKNIKKLYGSVNGKTKLIFPQADATEYQRVEWIQNTQNVAVIDTGVVLNSPRFKIQTSIYIEQSRDFDSFPMFCGHKVGDATQPEYYLAASYALGFPDIRLYIARNLSYYSIQYPADKYEITFENVFSDGNNYHVIGNINGTDFMTNDYECTITSDITDTITMNSGVSSYSAPRFYDTTIWKDGTKVRELYPCYHKVTGEGGMYDLVNEEFIPYGGVYSASQYITKGPDVPW